MKIGFKNLLLSASVLICGCSSDAVNLGFKRDLTGFDNALAEVENKKQAALLAEAHSAVAERIAPVGKVTMKEDLRSESTEVEVSGGLDRKNR